MKFIKLFEAFEWGNYLEELDKKTGVLKIRDEIWDLFVDLGDDFEDIEVQRDNYIINLEYKRKVHRKAKLYINWIERNKVSGVKPYAREIGELEDFLEKCELATKMWGELWIQIRGNNLLFESPEFISQISGIKRWADSLEMKTEFAVSTSSIQSSMEEVIKLIKFYEYKQFFMKFTFDLDKSKFEQVPKWKEEIPQSIISDFETFINNWRIPKKGQEELKNLIKKIEGDYSQTPNKEVP